MVSYAENPNVEVKVVTTVVGDQEYRQNCKYLLDRAEGVNKYYKKNRDCFEVDGLWYRKDSGLILFDYELQKWVTKNNFHLMQGIVAFEDNKPVIGYFSPNNYKNVRVSYQGSDRYHCIDVDLLEKNDYVEQISTGIWYPASELGSKSGRVYQSFKLISNDHSYKNKGYNIEDNGGEFVTKVNTFKTYSPVISKEVRNYARFLGNITFGAEVELSQGFIPSYLQHRLGIVMCRDGSIAGGEAVTIPLTGAKGLQTLKNIPEKLRDRTNVDVSCSYHLHLGTIPKDRAYICALYILAYRIQDDVFSMFPYYKTDPRGVKRKNYCQKLSKMQIHPLQDQSKEGFQQYIDEIYNRIFEFLSDGVPASQFNNRKQLRHPIHNKWDRPSRYRWLNLQNMIFSERGTAEFRIHHATLNAQKMTLWLFMCNAIVKYAETHQTEIFTGRNKIPFESVLNYYREAFPDSHEADILSTHLVSYYKDRQYFFARDKERGDRISEGEIRDDKNFVFQNPLF